METGVIPCTEEITNHRDFSRRQQILNELFGAYKFQVEVCYGTHIQISSFHRSTGEFGVPLLENNVRHFIMKIKTFLMITPLKYSTTALGPLP